MADDADTPIEDYGVVGNLETCALIGPAGSVDWFPFPHVESPGILAAVLDADRGGRFQIAPTESFESSQAYVDRTNVLETAFETGGGTVTITEFLPPAGRVDHPKKVLYRKVACGDGPVGVAVVYEPRFDDGRAETTVTATARRAHAAGGGEQTLLGYVSDRDLVAEELDTETGAHLGNFPQAFSHTGIVNSALDVAYARGREAHGPAPMGIRLGDPELDRAG